MRRLWTLWPTEIVLAGIFPLLSIIFFCTPVQAEWDWKYDKNSGQHAVYSEEVAVRTVEDKAIRTHLLIMFVCSPDDPEESFAMIFRDVPRFSNKDVIDLGKSRAFGIITSLKRKGAKPRVEYPQVKQTKDSPKIVFFDSSLIQKMRRYDELLIGFGWKNQSHVEGVIARVPLKGSAVLINEARRKCGLPHLP